MSPAPKRGGMAGNGGLFLAYTSRRDRHWSDAVRRLARHHAVVATDVRGRALQEILRHTDGTVWIEGRSTRPLRRVLVALDPDTPSSTNMRILDVGALLARVTGAEIFALHAWDAPGELLLEVHCSVVTAGEYVHSRMNRARAAFHDSIVRADAGIDDQHRWCERGRPSSVIADVARGRDIDAVVLGMARRPPLARALLGCTAVRVARDVACHVVVVASGEATSPGARLPRAIAMTRAA